MDAAAELLVVPQTTPITGTLLDHAEIIESIDWQPASGSGLYESYNCMVTDRVATWPCPPGTPPTKTFTSPTWPTGDRFSVYAGADCKRFGDTTAEDLDRLEAVFLAREAFGVERGMIERTLQGATNITPAGGAVSPKVGLAMLEAHAAQNYAGVPTIHMPRLIASLLSGDKVIGPEAGKLYSALGSKIAAGGGYDASNMGPAGTTTPANELWVYASGEAMVLRSKITKQGEVDRGTNQRIDLVERTYITSVDCYKAAIRVRIES